MSPQPPHSRENHPRRRASDVNAEIDRREAVTLTERMDALEEKLDANTAITEQNAALFEGLAAGIKVLGFLGAFFKWIIPIAAGVAWIYSFATTGHAPPPK